MTLDRWLAVIGVIASGLLSWIISRYFYKRSDKRRIPTFVVQSTKVLMESGLRSIEDLSVRFGRIEVGEEGITEAKIYFWNSGAAAILRSEVLEPYTITLRGAPILAFSVLKQSRDVIGLQLSRVGEDGEALELGFAVLEPGDGATLQIVYDGPPKTAIEFKGACLNAPKPTVLPPDPIYSLPVFKRFTNIDRGLLAFAMLPIAVIVLMGGPAWIVRRYFGDRGLKLFFVFIVGLFFGCTITVIVTAVWIHLKRMTAPYLPPDVKD
jgi:hypothetical protein